MWPFKDDGQKDEELNLCKDCRWCGAIGTNPEYAKCFRPVGINLVDGKTKTLDNFCDIERKYGNCCGSSGRYFEMKEN